MHPHAFHCAPITTAPQTLALSSPASCNLLQAGPVADIKLITDKNSGKSKGMAYVELQRAEDMLAVSFLTGEAAAMHTASRQGGRCTPQPEEAEWHACSIQ
jgi:hypothetical protein